MTRPNCDSICLIQTYSFERHTATCSLFHLQFHNYTAVSLYSNFPSVIKLRPHIINAVLELCHEIVRKMYFCYACSFVLHFHCCIFPCTAFSCLAFSVAPMKMSILLHGRQPICNSCPRRLAVTPWQAHIFASARCQSNNSQALISN